MVICMYLTYKGQYIEYLLHHLNLHLLILLFCDRLHGFISTSLDLSHRDLFTIIYKDILNISIINLTLVAKVQHYRGLNTDLDKLYNSIKQLLEDQKDLQIVSEYKGLLNNVPLRSIVAVNKSPKVWIGSLREIHISITGNPNDYAVEVASGAWFGSLVWPGAVGLVVGGPVGLAAGVAVGGLMAYEFEKHIWQKILEVIKKESVTQPTIDSVENHHDH